MLEANPSLTPNAVKAILQYTAQQYAGYDPLTQGSGFLNAVGAVRLARFYATAQPGDRVPLQAMWNKHIVWGNHRLGGGVLNVGGNAFSVGTTWGVARADNGDNIVWGTACVDAICSGDNIVWGTAGGDNIVWGTAVTGDNIVWGTDGGDNIVWGTDCGGADCDNVTWGAVDGDNIVWGTAQAGDNIVWGTALGDNIVWGTAAGDNIVWGTAAGDNIVWGTAVGDNIVWGTAGSLETVWVTAADGTQSPLSGTAVFDVLTDRQLLELLEYAPPPPTVLEPLPSDTGPITDQPLTDTSAGSTTLGEPATTSTTTDAAVIDSSASDPMATRTATATTSTIPGEGI
jgi:hypothetical protein